jgi:glutathione S-transferase
MTDAKIVLWQMQPLWGIPNPSPFCLKVETWLRMVGLPYEARAIDGPPKSKAGKVPYIERADGSVLWDSSVIIDTLTRERGVDLDRALSARDRAIGTLLQRTFEEDLYFTVLHERWVDDQNWPRVAQDYFGHFPWALRKLVLPIVRRKVIASAHGQGVSRLPEGQRIGKAKADLHAIAELLSDKPFFFGQPSSYDAMAYGFLANVYASPLASPISDEARAHANLVAYCERMKKAYWADWKG